MPWFILSIYFLAQMIIDQPTCHVLIVGRIFTDEVSCALDQSLLDVTALDAIIELYVAAQFNFAGAHTSYAFGGPKDHPMHLL